MNLKFWKKKPRADESVDSQEAENDKTVAMEVSDLDTSTPAQPGMFSRVKDRLAGLSRRFKKTPAAEAESEEEVQSPKAHEDAQTGETPPHRPMHTKKRLIIGGAVGLLILLLTGIGFAAWKIFSSSPEHDAAAPATAGASNRSPQDAHSETKQAETSQAEIEALRKKNDELQAQIEALKKEQPQDQPSPGVAGGNTSTSSGAGEMTLSNKDPKAAAQSLKEAIEAMNASSGGSTRKPAK